LESGVRHERRIAAVTKRAQPAEIAARVRVFAERLETDRAADWTDTANACGEFDEQVPPMRLKVFRGPNARKFSTASNDGWLNLTKGWNSAMSTDFDPK